MTIVKKDFEREFICRNVCDIFTLNIVSPPHADIHKTNVPKYSWIGSLGATFTLLIGSPITFWMSLPGCWLAASTMQWWWWVLVPTGWPQSLVLMISLLLMMSWDTLWLLSKPQPVSISLVCLANGQDSREGEKSQHHLFFGESHQAGTKIQ